MLEFWEFVDKDFKCEIPECKTMTRIRCQDCWSTICAKHVQASTILNSHNEIMHQFLYCPTCYKGNEKRFSYIMIIGIIIFAAFHVGQEIVLQILGK